MTREESKVKNFDVLHFVADNAGLSTFEAIEKAYNMGVSEQNAVLDKIRAEIEQIYEEIDTVSHNEYENAVEQGKERAYEKVLDIIDKYKAESEG